MTELIVKIGAQIDGLQKGLKESEARLQAFGQKATAIGTKLSLAVTTPLLAIGAASVKAASDAEETASKFSVVFRDIQKDAEESFKSLRNEYGLSNNASRELLSSTGDLLTGFGFSQEAALDLSTEVNKLAVDLASFTNFSGGAKGASDALTKALLGERESVKSLGISILEEDVKKQVAINTAKGLTFETERQAKAYATLDLAIAQSGNAIGDYARTSGSFANQTKLLQSRISDLGVSIGEVLLPLASRLNAFVLGLVERFNNLDVTTKRIVVVIAGLVAGIGPLLLIIGSIIQILPVLGVALAALTGPIGLIVTGVAAAATLIILNFDEIKRNAQLLLLEIIDFAQKSVKALNFFAKAIPGLSTGLVAADLALQSMGESVASSIVEGLGNKGSNAIELFNNELKNAKLALIDVGNEIVNTSKKVLQNPLSIGKRSLPSTALPALTPTAGVNTDPLIIDDSKFKAFTDKLKAFEGEVQNILQNGISNTIGDFAFSIGEALSSGGNIIESGGKALLSGIGQIANQLGQAAIAIGVGMLAIKASFKNPFTAIAAGVALVALAGFINNQVSKIPSGTGSVGGVGGGSSGQGQTFGGRPEALNLNRRERLVAEVRGADLRFVLQEANRRTARD